MSATNPSSAYFERVAGQWDELRSGYFGEEVRQTAIAKAYLRPEMAVADVGAGTGFIAAGLAPLVARVYVVDGSPEMLAVARENLKTFENVEFHEADGLNLPFPDESLDAVFANMYLHHAPDPLAAIREMVRVLRPGGRLVITDMDSHPYAWLKDEMADVWQGFERAAVRDWLREAGLVNRLVNCTGQSCCAESGCAELCATDAGKAQISVFIATGTRRMSVRDSVQSHYAAHAVSGSSCNCSSEPAAKSTCCSGESAPEPSAEARCCTETQARLPEDNDPARNGYTPVELSDAPQEAAQFSLGCGNPIALAGLKPGETALDIGSGGGLDCFLAAERVGPTGRVIGVDMTPEMLERARASAARHGIANVEFRQGEAESLPVEDGAVDVIFSNCVINLVEDKGRVFEEIFRALKPGGRTHLSDVLASGAIAFELSSDPEAWSQCVSGALPEPEYVDLLSQAGFVEVQVQRSPAQQMLGDVAVYSALVSASKPA